MTPLLTQAVDQARQLTPAAQDAIAERILEEIDEERWQAAFARSQDKLALLAAEVRANVAAGKATPGGFAEE